MRHTRLYEKERLRASRKKQKYLTKRDLVRKNSAFYRKGGDIDIGRRREETIEYIVRRSFEAMPKAMQQEFSDYDKELNIKNLARTMFADKSKKINAYKILLNIAEYKKNARGGGTLELIWGEFKVQRPDVYSHYNTYVYRLGHSPKQWFMDNAEHDQKGKYVDVSLSLPDKAGGIIYDTLELTFDFSGGEITDAYIQ